MGDTGLWYVPTGEVLPRKKWSMSAYRVNFDDNQGFTDVSNWPLDVRLRRRRQGRDLRLLGPGQPRRPRHPAPLLSAASRRWAASWRTNPLMNDTWNGNQLGDLWIGAKWNLMSEWHQQPVAFALRPMIKLPTGKQGQGRRHRQGGLRRRRRGQQGRSTSASRSRATAASSSAAAPTRFERPTGSAGASAPASRRARASASPPSSRREVLQGHAHHQGAPDRRPTARSCRSASSRS